jgi:hypothetical protein
MGKSLYQEIRRIVMTFITWLIRLNMVDGFRGCEYPAPRGVATRTVSGRVLENGI